MKLILLTAVCTFVAAMHDDGRVDHRWEKFTSGDGWALVGKYCMGYSSAKTGRDSVGGMMQIGNIDLVIRPASSGQNFENLTVLIYDDEPTSWGALTQDMACSDKYGYAKDFKMADEFRVDLSAGQWQMPSTPLYEHQEPREWYVVLARCNNTKNEDRNFDVLVDLQWTDEGVYDNEMGPNSCTDYGTTANHPRIALSVFVGIFGVATTLLAFYVRAQRNALKAGRGQRVGDTDTDETATIPRA